MVPSPPVDRDAAPLQHGGQAGRQTARTADPPPPHEAAHVANGRSRLDAGRGDLAPGVVINEAVQRAGHHQVGFRADTTQDLADHAGPPSVAAPALGSIQLNPASARDSLPPSTISLPCKTAPPLCTASFLAALGLILAPISCSPRTSTKAG